jgi:hypothetical protein
MHGTTVPRTPGRFRRHRRQGSPIGGKGGLWIGGEPRPRAGRQPCGIPRGAHAAVLPLPRNVGSVEQGAGIGVAYMTAWAAIVSTARLQKGGVGPHHGHDRQRGRHRGVDRPWPGGEGDRRRALATADLARVGSLPVDAWIDLQAHRPRRGSQGRDRWQGRRRCPRRGRGRRVREMPRGSRVAREAGCDRVRAPAARRVQPGRLLPQRVAPLLGLDSLKLSFEEAAGILRSLTPLMERGEPSPRAKVDAYPLGEAPRLYREIDAATLKGKPVLVP